MKKLFVFVCLLLAHKLQAQTMLYVPDTLSGTSFQLTMHADSVPFFSSGPWSPTYAFNMNAYLGPTLILNQGDSVTITVDNQIGDTTTIHWHGLHVPAKFDGGPHTPILPGASWQPSFRILDQAATYWYHPHMHMKTALQAIRGAAGMIIIRDANEATKQLPRNYGVDDFPVIVQCQQYDSLNAAMPLGMEDSTLLVNGARANYGHSVYVDVPAQQVRFRLLNASGERVFNFGLSGNQQFQMIASDGGLLNAPVTLDRIRLAPGERAEIVVDFSAMQGQQTYLMSYASELPMGIQGGPTMPMPFGPPMDSPLNGVDFQVMTIHVTAPNANPVTSISTTLNNLVPYDTAQASATRIIRFTADSAMVMDGPFYFNDSLFNMDRIDFTIQLNSIERWRLVNETMVAHPFHIHDVQFYLIDRGGLVPVSEELGRKDVVLIPSGDSVEFITRFDHYADSMIPYMYHCHILMHEDAGMMGQFLVVESATGVASVPFVKAAAFPNPVRDIFHIQLPESINGSDIVKIYSVTGKLIGQKNASWSNGQTDLSLADLNPGVYVLGVEGNLSGYKVKFVKVQ